MGQGGRRELGKKALGRHEMVQQTDTGREEGTKEGRKESAAQKKTLYFSLPPSFVHNVMSGKGGLKFSPNVISQKISHLLAEEENVHEFHWYFVQGWAYFAPPPPHVPLLAFSNLSCGNGGQGHFLDEEVGRRRRGEEKKTGSETKFF